MNATTAYPQADINQALAVIATARIALWDAHTAHPELPADVVHAMDMAYSLLGEFQKSTRLLNAKRRSGLRLPFMST